MRTTIRGLALIPAGLLAAGLAVTMSTAAMASTIPAGAQDYSPAPVGWQAGNGHWNFRFITTDFTVPESACNGDDDATRRATVKPAVPGTTGSDAFEAAGVLLNGGTGTTFVGVTCDGDTPYAGYADYYTGTTDPHGITNTLAVTADDQIRAQIYYDQDNNRVYLTETDLTAAANNPNPHSTTNGILVQDSFRAEGGQYVQSFAGAFTDNPLTGDQPSPGSSFVLVPFTNTYTTSYNGTRGCGLNGPWGVQADYARHGAHTTAAAPVLYDCYTTFNVREYGNA